MYINFISTSMKFSVNVGVFIKYPSYHRITHACTTWYKVW